MEEEEGGKGLQLCPPWLVWDGGGEGRKEQKGQGEREREGGGEGVNDKVEEEDYTKWSITVFLSCHNHLMLIHCTPPSHKPGNEANICPT